MNSDQTRIINAKNLGWRSIRPISLTGFPPWYSGNNETFLEPIPQMKEITLKTILTINGREYLVNSQNLSETVAEYESEQEYELDDKEVFEYIVSP
jgi:hypothetical protein